MIGRKDCQFFKTQNDCVALKAMDCRQCSFFKKRKGASVEEELEWYRTQKYSKSEEVSKKPLQNP